MTPSENTPEEIRAYVRSYLQDGRKLYAGQAERNRKDAAPSPPDTPLLKLRSAKDRREAAAWAEMSDRYVVEFDRAIGAVEREFAAEEVRVISDLDRLATSLDALAARCATGPDEGPFCWLKLTGARGVAKLAKKLRGDRWRRWLANVLADLAKVEARPAPVYVLRKSGVDLAWNGFGWVELDAKPFRYTRREHAEREAKSMETVPTWIEVVEGEPITDDRATGRTLTKRKP